MLLPALDLCLQVDYQKISCRISLVFGVVRLCIEHVSPIDSAAPSRDHRLVPREPLQESQRVLSERDIEEHFNVVEQNHVRLVCICNLGKQNRQLQRPLTLTTMRWLRQNVGAGPMELWSYGDQEETVAIYTKLGFVLTPNRHLIEYKFALSG